MNESEGVVEHNPIILISICVATFLALLAFVYPGFSFIGTDGVSYALLAKNIATGNGFTLFGHPHTFFSPLTAIAITPLYLLFGDADFAARMAVILFEVLTLIAFYFAARRFADARVAAVATFLLSVSGPFVWDVLTVWAQPLAGLLTVLFVYSSLRYIVALEKGEKLFLLSGFLGVLAGALYLNRPEYFFLPIPLILFLVLLNKKYVSMRKNIGLVLMPVLGFLLLATPYVIYLHQELGDWTFTGRLSEQYLHQANLPNLDGSIIKPPTRLSENPLVLMVKEVFSFSFLKNYLKEIYSIEWITLRAFGVIGFTFFGIGIRYLLLQGDTRKLFAITVPASMLFTLALGYTGGGYGYITPYLPLFLLIIATGYVQFSADLTQVFKWKKKTANVFLVSTVLISGLYFSSVIFQQYFFRPESTKKPLEFQRLGEWFQAHEPNHEGITIASRKPEIAFYAKSNWRELTGDEGVDPKHLVAVLRREGVAYIAIDTRILGGRAALFVDERGYYRDGEGIPPVATEDFAGQKVSLFYITQ